MKSILVFALAVPLTLGVQQRAAGQAHSPGSGLARGLVIADSLVSAAVEHTIPGAVLVVARNGRVLHQRAFGWAQLNDFQVHRLAHPRPMHTSTLFDLASVTKVMATTMAVMMLASEGKIDVDAPVYTYLPDFRGVHLDSITVRHLLTHSAGLVQWQPLYYHAANERETYDVIRQMPLQWGVGEGRHYSDLGFMLLGYIVEHVTRQPLDRFVHDSLYVPLRLRSTTYLPKRHGFADFAATEQGNAYERHMVYDSTFGYRYLGDPRAWKGWRQYVLNGETDDGNSWYANNGVAGHAGLFATAADLHVLIDLLLTHGTAGGHRFIRPDVVDRFLTRDQYQNFLGWMSPNGLPAGSFSHTGFTGTYVLGVPAYGLSIVLLTNRQNMGTDARGYFPDVGPLQAAVSRALVAGAQVDAGFGICVPRAEHTPENVGCFIVTSEAQGTLGPPPVFWHVTRLDSSRASATPPHAARFDAFGDRWLMTIGDSAWQPLTGTQVAVIGPLPVSPGVTYNAVYMEASMRPGMKSAIHRHSGAEAWYTLSGETCLETPSGTQVGRANAPPVIVPGGLPMELTATGSTIRRSLVLILHDAMQPPTTVLTTWKPRHLCDKMK